MIGRLVGRVAVDSADGSIVFDVNGVGYEVTVPLGTLGRLTPSSDGLVTLYVHTVVREDAFLLFGFATLDDRAAFRQVIAISNVGPKIAMSILSAMTVSELAQTIARGEVKRLVGVPGVGKKTAERLVLELKDKIAAPTGAMPATVSRAADAPKPATAKADLLQGTLTRMGFRPSEAERAVASLGSRVEEAELGDLVREALALLSK